MQYQPLTTLLEECKRRKPSSRVSKNFVIRAYYFFTGGKVCFYAGLIIVTIGLSETMRTESGLAFFHRSLSMSATLIGIPLLVSIEGKHFDRKYAFQ